MQVDIAATVLCLLVLDLGMAFGAGLYEARIVVPLWGSAPPESLHSPDSGRRFWAFVTTVPLTALTLASAALLLLWPMDGVRRMWWTLATGLVLVERCATFGYFIPMLARLGRAQAFAWKDIRRRFAVWSRLNYGRLGLVLAAWLCALAAFAAG